MPASTNGQSSVETVAVVQRPVVNNFRIVFGGGQNTAVNEQLNSREFHGNGIVVPLPVAYLEIWKRCDVIQMSIGEWSEL